MTTDKAQRDASHIDPAGRPYTPGSPKFTDQQAGGDMTGAELDSRDDNFVETRNVSQAERDISGGTDDMPRVSADLLREEAVRAITAPLSDPASAQTGGSALPGKHADSIPVPPAGK